MNDKQRAALSDLAHRYGGELKEEQFIDEPFDLPPGYVAGWIYNNRGVPRLYVGCDSEGNISS